MMISRNSVEKGVSNGSQKLSIYFGALWNFLFLFWQIFIWTNLWIAGVNNILPALFRLKVWRSLSVFRPTPNLFQLYRLNILFLSTTPVSARALGFSFEPRIRFPSLLRWLLFCLGRLFRIICDNFFISHEGFAFLKSPFYLWFGLWLFAGRARECVGPSCRLWRATRSIHGYVGGFCSMCWAVRMFFLSFFLVALCSCSARRWPWESNYH